MANSFDYAVRFLPLLDEIYIENAKTAILTGSNNQVKPGLSEGEVRIAKRTITGLGDFSRVGSESTTAAYGYTEGNVTVEWETIKYDKERSATFRIDRLNQNETLEVAFGGLAEQFIKEKVVPETDAARIAAISTVAITNNNYAYGAMADGAAVISALRAGINKLEENEVGSEWVLFIKSPYLGAIQDMNSFASKEALTAFSDIITVPTKRMYSAITLNDGKTSYGYVKANGAVDVDFLIVAKDSVVCDMKQYLKYFSPEVDQFGDAHVFKYRNYNLYGRVLDNKVNGVYVHTATDPKAE